jgi:hypothetical protein
MEAMQSTPLDSSAESAILAALGAGQMAASELKKRVQAKVRLDNEQYTAQLNALLAQRKIHQRRNLGKDGRPTKTLGSYAVGAPPPPPPPPGEIAPKLILTMLEAGPLPLADLKQSLKKALPQLRAPALTGVLAELVAAGQVHGRRKRGKSGKPNKTITSYALGGPPAADFIAPVLSVWAEVHAEAVAAGVKGEALVAALLDALRALGSGVPTPGAAAYPVDDRADVLQSVRALEAREGRGALIPIRKLRAALHLNKERLDAALLGLYADDAVILHHHDYVGSLTESERSELVLDRHGNHYVGVALRGGS